jgi:hypothetical protein
LWWDSEKTVGGTVNSAHAMYVVVPIITSNCLHQCDASESAR